MTIFSRTELRIGVSKAKNCEEIFFEVHFYVAPGKQTKNSETQIFESEKIRKKKCSTSKNELSGIVRNVPGQSFTAVRALFGG